MKAAQIKRHGGVEVIEINEIAVPQVLPKTVLVKVRGSSINPVDWKIREGMFAPPSFSFPFTLGSDVAGIIAEVGDGVEGFAPGNQVYGFASALAGGSGSFAEYALAPAAMIAPMPKNCDFVEAASSVLTGCSAVQALTEHISLQAGQKILIQGGAGGIGSMAIRLAKHLGVYVAATASGQGIELAKNLGADEVIDYRMQKFEKLISGYDAVFDTVGGEAFEKSFQILKPGGVIVSMVGQDTTRLAERYGVKFISQFTQVTQIRLEKLTQLIESGVLKVRIDKTFLLENIVGAFLEQESGNALGKIAIEINKK